MKLNYRESLRSALRELLEEPEVFLLGEDIAEPYGGAFQISKGLSDEFPGRVINMPMSEQAFVGMGVGMALAGYRPIVEIMFGDFVTLILDQMLNHASKFQEGFAKKLHLVVRTPMGGYRGYGATHSQSLEKLYMGLPNLWVMAPSVFLSPGELLKKAVRRGCPVLFCENKLDYTRKMFEEEKIAADFEIHRTGDDFPVSHVGIKGETAEICILAYGGLAHPLAQMMHELYMDEELAVDMKVFSLLSPLDMGDWMESMKAYRYILTVEEGHVPFGWGDALISALVRQGVKAEFESIGAAQRIIGAALQEECRVLPDMDSIRNRIVRWKEEA